MNKIFITGNMVGEAKVKTLSSGKDLTSFSVAESTKKKMERMRRTSLTAQRLESLGQT